MTARPVLLLTAAFLGVATSRANDTLVNRNTSTSDQWVTSHCNSAEASPGPIVRGQNGATGVLGGDLSSQATHPTSDLTILKLQNTVVPSTYEASGFAESSAAMARCSRGCECVCDGSWNCGDECGLRFRLSELTIYPTFSYRGNKSASYNEFEFASFTEFGNWEMENRTVLNVADLPSTIRLGPTNPGSEPTLRDVRASGFGDVLSGFFFGRRAEHSDTHFRIGPVWTFPSATNDILGSGQFSVGPGLHYSTEIGRMTAGCFVWQSWGFAVDESQERINQLFGKPFLIYELTEKWHLVYIPLGMSHSWEKPSKRAWTVPVGGGVRRLFTLCGQEMGFQAQLFDYVARKKYDPEWEFRMTIEFLFD